MKCVAQRLFAGIEVDANGCWVWTKATWPTGYGAIRCADQTMEYTHRVAVELFHGPIPSDQQVDHLCRNRACCNPTHLEVVTQRENIMRGEGFVPAHAANIDCGYERCGSCRRHRMAVSS